MRTVCLVKRAIGLKVVVVGQAFPGVLLWGRCAELWTELVVWTAEETSPIRPHEVGGSGSNYDENMIYGSTELCV